MKYKNIYSAIHNFGASFTSLMNYVDDGYVIDDLQDIHNRGLDIKIDWLKQEFSPGDQANERIMHSIAQMGFELKAYLFRENVDVYRLSSLSFFWPAKGRKYMLAVDDREKEYKIFVGENK